MRERLEDEQRAAKGLTDAETPTLEDKKQRSFAEADGRIMLMKRGAYDYAYNAQAAVEAEGGVIVAATLTNIAPDMGHLPGLVAAVRALRAATDLPASQPTTVSADTGYFSCENIAADRDGIDLLIAAGRGERRARAAAGQCCTADCFAYDAERDVWLCPADKVLAQQQSPPGAMGCPRQDYYQAMAADCTACSLRQQCLQPAEERRLLLVRHRRTTGGMRFKLRQASARRRYARQKVIVKPIFGQIREDRGLTALSFRGLVLAREEWLLACLAHNLGKLLRVCALPAMAVAA